MAPTASTSLKFFKLFTRAAVFDPLPWTLSVILLSGIVLEVARFRLASYVNVGYWTILSALLFLAMIIISHEIASKADNLDLYGGSSITKAALPFVILIALGDLLLYWEPWRQSERQNRVVS
jgi:hypothetical protein